MRDSVAEELSLKLSPVYFVRSSLSSSEDWYRLEPSTLQYLADQIFGEDQWSRSERDLRLESAEKDGDEYVVCMSCIGRVTLASGTFREDVGFATCRSRDLNEARERCTSFVQANSFVRAMRLFGDSLGNCLYNREFMSYLKEHSSHEFRET